jgi:ubiquinone/menaquinone biosynthesis C-methylase UbiE
MKPSSLEPVRALYDASAGNYSGMMDSEIDLPMYADTLGRLAERLVGMSGPVVDASCGSGHMLARYRERYDPGRPLVGVDLSPAMVALATERLGPDVVVNGDMRDLHEIEPGTAAAVIGFFALHHIGTDDMVPTLCEWHRVIRDQGQVVLATWEGAGVIDYGDASDVVALRYRQDQVRTWVERAGFVVERCVVDPVDDMPMDAVYVEATKGALPNP